MHSSLILVNALKLHEGPNRWPAGNCQHVLQLAAELARDAAHDIRFLTDRNSYDALAAHVDAARLVPTPLKGTSVVHADLAVIRAVRALRPAVYHRPTGQLPLVPLPCRTVMGIADLGFAVLPHPPLKRLYKELSYRWSARRADRVICVSRFTRDDVARRLRVPEEKLRVILHGANVLPEPDFRLADTVGMPFFLVFAHQPHKNAELCLNAAADLRSRHPGVGLVLVGPGAAVSRRLLPLAQRLGIGGSVRLVGMPTGAELAGLYRRALALLFPSWFEGFGLPVLEAMRLGCPVVCSDRCSLPEVAGDAAVQVAPDDLRGMTSAMLRMAGDAAWRGERSAAGKRRAARFTWRRAAEETLAVYDELLAQSGPGARFHNSNSQGRQV